MSVRMAKKKQWDRCSGQEIAWIGLHVKMSDLSEIADWIEALSQSGGCGFGSDDAFGGSSNSLATWMAVLADKIRETGKGCDAKKKGQWLDGHDSDCEFAYCSECGHMEFAGWDTHGEAKKKVGEFFKEYRYCPWCGVKMEGGQYVE